MICRKGRRTDLRRAEGCLASQLTCTGTLGCNDNMLMKLEISDSILLLLTSAQLLHGRSAADVSPAYAAPPSLVPCTNRPFRHQRR